MQIKIIKLQLKESKNREGSYIYIYKIKTFEVENTVCMNNKPTQLFFFTQVFFNWVLLLFI
jgi:hypothetical protein